MIVDAECRYLTQNELSRVRAYAQGMPMRLEVMRRVEVFEEQIVESAVAAFVAKHPSYFQETPDSRAKTRRDMKLTLRYVTLAYVREDIEFFRRNYAQWISELLRAICPKEVLIDGQNCLRAAIESTLDPAEARPLCSMLDVFIEELAR
jgi:hypothetical protein